MADLGLKPRFFSYQSLDFSRNPRWCLEKRVEKCAVPAFYITIFKNYTFCFEIIVHPYALEEIIQRHFVYALPSFSQGNIFQNYYCISRPGYWHWYSQDNRSCKSCMCFRCIPEYIFWCGCKWYYFKNLVPVFINTI